MNPECPKCGARMTGPSFHRSWMECRAGEVNKPHGEHLHYRCACGYDQTRPTRDAEPAPPSRETEVPVDLKG